jgi:hypothetical protein
MESQYVSNCLSKGSAFGCALFVCAAEATPDQGLGTTG